MKKAKIYYARMGEFWRKEEKYNQLEKLRQISNVDLNSVGYIPRSLLRSVKTASEGVLLSEAEPRSVRGVAK
ncbi:MAG: hypothetical protein DCF12_22670 [Snowella sp.]|nr:MAG: hypothetical protein DCF12_22670 [Snowella sp.]